MSSALIALAGFESYCGRSPDLVARDLEGFFALLTKWQKAQNLVSRETLSSFWERHVRDSLQLLPLLEPNQQIIVDLGSGGGFPAIPLAIASQGSLSQFIMVDSNRRKISFLRAAILEFDLNAQALDQRIEDVDLSDIGAPDLITCRATASLEQILKLSRPLRTPETSALLHKGREFREEIIKARAKFDFDVVSYPSETDPDSAILRLTQIQDQSITKDS